VLELTMASSLRSEVPAIPFNQLNHITDFHIAQPTDGFTVSSPADSNIDDSHQG
jgi:hypothetical protein